jgi:hypothetical protein
VDSVRWCEPGGIRTLVKCIDEHPVALAYDFREQFGLSIRDIGGAVSWCEAVLLFCGLYNKPGTQTYAAVREHDYAMSLEAMELADLIDSFRQANSKGKPKSYPRPWKSGSHKSATPTVSQDVIREALRERGYEL